MHAALFVTCENDTIFPETGRAAGLLDWERIRQRVKSHDPFGFHNL